VAYIDNNTNSTVMAGGARVEDYISLLKPRVMSLVVFVGLVGMLVAPGSIHPIIGLIAIACIAIGAGASGALNMWYDSDIDAVMSRTVNRAIPAGRMPRNDALVFGLVLSVFSVMLLALATNWFAGAFLAFTIFFYSVVYTVWLKRSTPQNIVIGGAAGAFPPMVGWAAVTGDASWVSFSLFLIIFLWTPPHFWALALYKQGDYGAAGVPMMPNVAGEKSTRRQIFVYSLLLALSSVAPILLGFSSWIYGVVATVVAIGFVWHATRLLLANESVEMRKRARSLFTYSLSYLAILFMALLIDNIALRLGVL
jgi:protoheme IX farnesyltransferase